MSNFKKYKIKKGSHYSGLRISPFYDKTVTKYEVTFTESCLYDLHNEDNYDINKLFGLAYTHHHIDSARFGWRADGDKIELSLYCYKEGKRHMKEMCHLEVGATYTLAIKNVGDYYEFLVSSDTSSFMSYAKVSKPKTNKFGYKLWPYFGGNESAPHTIEIMMRKIE